MDRFQATGSNTSSYSNSQGMLDTNANYPGIHTDLAVSV
jgi:hypothetical protein